MFFLLIPPKCQTEVRTVSPSHRNLLTPNVMSNVQLIMFLLSQYAIYAWRGENAKHKAFVNATGIYWILSFVKVFCAVCVRAGVHEDAQRGMRREAISFIREIVIEIKLHLMHHD